MEFFEESDKNLARQETVYLLVSKNIFVISFQVGAVRLQADSIWAEYLVDVLAVISFFTKPDIFLLLLDIFQLTNQYC